MRTGSGDGGLGGSGGLGGGCGEGGGGGHADTVMFCEAVPVPARQRARQR